MAKFKGGDVEENVACNLIPMIDIMFLLLLFFMLGADMGQRELTDVTLPQADMAKEQSNVRGAEDETTVNVFHGTKDENVSCPVFESGGVCREDSHWFLAIRGQLYTRETLASQLKVEADQSLEPEEDKTAGKRLSARKVMIRADQAAPYGYIQRVIEACALAGIYKIEVGAAKERSEG